MSRVSVSRWFIRDFADLRTALSALKELNIETILGERLDLASLPKTVVNDKGVSEKVVRTQSGKEINAGLVVRWS
jgi:hypothetical protein